MASGQPITKLEVSISKDEEEHFTNQGYQLINVDLNEGAYGNKVFLWYKKEYGKSPVTRIEFSFTDRMKSGLADAGYKMVNRDLNAGVWGDNIFLWYFCGSSEYNIPIVDLKVTKSAKEEPVLLKDGWERLGCDLNRNTQGKIMYLWVKREKTSYIHEIAATVDFTNDKYMFELGFTRVCENTTRNAGGQNYVFLWYRRTTDKSKALAALDVSTSHEDEIEQGYEKLSVDLNTGTTGKMVYLWYKKEGDQSIQSMALLINPEAWIEYKKAGIKFIEKNLNEGNDGLEMYIAYM
ncbi:hypothetical protein ABG768_007009 [Culter alburnus]|uniref:MABP domain-containing protein n=1 Tax=Culter alburnus TaxID=194366 RepID=A0AAW1ZT83_CULAL